MPFPSDWLVPDWPVPAGVRSVFTTRAGGASAPPFDSFNLGEHVRDEPVVVLINRRRLRDACGARPVFLSQVHGVEVVSLDGDTADGTEADACLTARTGVVCTVMVADCLPVLWCLPDGTAVAASHAGWRGLAGQDGHGILETTFQALMTLSATAPAPMVWLGPCIGPKAFEVGTDVRDAFVSVDADAARCFDALPAQGKYLADLPALARRRLGAMGVTKIFGNNSSDAWCTVTQSSRFFSHRRDAARLGSTGRMAACIWKV